MKDALYHADCMDILPTIPDKSVDLILCDLPYGITANKWDCELPLADIWMQYIDIIRPDGNIVLFSAGMFTARLMVMGQDLFRYKMVWVKNVPTNHLNAKIQPMRKYEDICVFSKPKAKFNQVLLPGEPYRVTPSTVLSTNYGAHKKHLRENSGTRVPIDVLYHDIPRKGRMRRGKHPTEKPVSLCRYLVRLYTDPGDVVLDNTMGAGTSLVAARLEGRVGIGIENDLHWYNHAKQRLHGLRPNPS